MRSSASATKLPMSRPRTFVWTTSRRSPFSWLIASGVGAAAISAIRPRGIRSPPGATMGSDASAAASVRLAGGKRTTTGNRRAPSMSWVTVLPATAVSTNSWTSPTWSP